MAPRKRDNVVSWASLLCIGLLLSYFGAYQLLTGRPGIRWGVEIPAWTGWIELPSGLCMVFLSIRALANNLRKAKSVKVCRRRALAGAALLACGALVLFTGADHSFWGFPVFALASAFFPLVGLCVIALSVRASEFDENERHPRQLSAEEAGTDSADPLEPPSSLNNR